MMPAPLSDQAPVPPPAYHRAQRRLGPRLGIDALTQLRELHLLALCRLAVRLARRRCPPPLPAGLGERPRRYREESLLLLALLRTLWRLSYRDLHDWLVAWPALALACGLPTDRRGRPAVRAQRLISARDLIVDSAPILAWRRRDPDAALGHALHHHARPLLWGYRVHTLLCRGSGLPLLAFVAPANGHDAPFARPLLETAVHLYGLRPRVVRLDAGYWGLRLVRWIHVALGAVAVVAARCRGWTRFPHAVAHFLFHFHRALGNCAKRAFTSRRRPAQDPRR
jgi:hypothetical protein